VTFHYEGPRIITAIVVPTTNVPDSAKTNKDEDSTKAEEADVKTTRLRLRLKMPNMRRSNSDSDSERTNTAASTLQDLESMRQDYDEAVDDMEMDIGMDAGIEDEETH
jgi:hypothetical protein